MYRLVWLLFILLGGHGITLGQKLPFVNSSLSNGLSNPNVTCFAQDLDGFTWIGTENGLNRFDGAQIRSFGKDDGLPNEHVLQLCLVGNTIYGAVAGGHMFMVQNQKISPLNVNATELSEIYDLKMHNDTLWIAAMRGVYTYVDEKFEQLPYFAERDSLAVSGIEFNDQGVLYAATHHFGIFKRKNNSHFVRLPMPEIRGVLDFTFLPNNQIYLAGHYFLLSVGKNIIKQYVPFNDRSRNWSKAIVSDKNGGLWIGSDETGLYHFLDGNLVHYGIENGLLAKSINSLFIDREQVLWIGTVGKGFYRLYPQKLRLYEELDDDDIIGIHKTSNNKIWVSSLTGGLQLYSDSIAKGNYKTREFEVDAAYNQFRNQPYFDENGFENGFINQASLIPKPNYTVWCMVDNSSTTWFGMNYALYQVNPLKTSSFNRDESGFPSDVVYSLDLKNDSLWVGLELGAVCLVNSKMVWKHKSPDSIKNSTKIIFCDSKGRVWLGGNKKGLQKKIHETVIEAIPNKAWQNTQVTDIIEDSKGRIWVSSNGEGIAIIENDKFYFLNEGNGLPTNKIMSLAIDDNMLVVGTYQGIFQTTVNNVNPEKCEFIQVDLSEKFALPCNRNAAQVDAKGRFWFGTTAGVLCYIPETEIVHSYKPRPYLVNAQLLYASTPLDSFVSQSSIPNVPYSQNSLRFKVGSIYYPSQENLQYSYQLVGNEQGWSDGNQSVDITFNDLAPGEYKLMVKAKDQNANWGPEAVLSTFSIQTPFWLSWWFRIASLATLIAVSVATIKYRTRRLKTRNRLLEEYAAEKNQEVQKQNELLAQGNKDKEALLQEIHHRVKNNLQIIISLLSLQLRRVKDYSGQKVLQQSIGRIKTMSLIHQNLYQTENLSRTNFKTYLAELLEHIMSNFEDVAQIEYSISGDEIELGTEKAIPLALIAHEWVNNIYKHAFPNKKGRVEIILAEDATNYSVQICDNGIGISKEEFMASKNSLGAKIIRSLSRQIDAELDIYRRAEGGTILKLKLKH